MKLMSVDYGDARTGVAVSDSSGTMAFPVGVIKEYDAERLADRLAETAREQGADQIVVGLPLNMNGTRGDRAERCEALGELLRERVSCPVVMFDERSTTVKAHEILSVNNVRGKKRKAVVDAVAAVVILENYIATRPKRQDR